MVASRELIRELFGIQKLFAQYGVAEEHKRTIASIAEKAFENTLHNVAQENTK